MTRYERNFRTLWLCYRALAVLLVAVSLLNCVGVLP